MPDVFTHEYFEAIRDELGAHAGFVPEIPEHVGFVIKIECCCNNLALIFGERRTHLGGNYVALS
jgi:hypothetical protein